MTPEQAALAAAYLASDDPLRQSGFSGGPLRWELLRRPIAAAVHRPGSFLDVGCANGVLLDCVVRWCAERGVAVEPYGLDVSPELVALARARHPAWADRFVVGDAASWRPPRRWDWVRTELEYVDPAARPRYVARLLDEFLAPGGSLLVCRYRSRHHREPGDDEPVDGTLAAWGFPVARVHRGIDEDGVERTTIAVVGKPAGAPVVGSG